MRFQPAIFIWFVFAQFFIKFNKSCSIQKLQDWSFKLWKNYFCRSNIERARRSQSSITFSLIHPVYIFTYSCSARRVSFQIKFKLIQFEKKFVGQNMNLWIYTPRLKSSSYGPAPIETPPIESFECGASELLEYSDSHQSEWNAHCACSIANMCNSWIS